MNLELLQFQKDFAKDIVEQVFHTTKWSPTDSWNREVMYQLAALKRPPFAAQVENGILPLRTALLEYKVGILIAEMGTGKTQMSFSAAYTLFGVKGKQKLLFLTAGGKHVPKMAREAKEIYGDQCKVYFIVAKNPESGLAKDKLKKDEVSVEMAATMEAQEGEILVFILSKDTAKIDLSEEVVYTWGQRCPECHKRIEPRNHKRGKAYPEKLKPYECPNCSHSFVTKVSRNIWEGNGVFKNREVYARKTGSRRISLGKTLRRLRGHSKNKLFDMLIVDEVHEMQSGTSLQGRVYRDLVLVSERVLIMTGTLSNGYASSVFYILQAILPLYFKKMGYGFNDVGKFVEHFGAKKYTTAKDIVEKKGSKTFVKVNELPKISERIVSLLAPFSVWLKMEDLNLKMPPYSEEAKIVSMNDELYRRLNKYREETTRMLKTHNPKLMKSFAQRFMYLQNNPAHAFEYEFDGEITIENPVTGNKVRFKRTFTSKFEPFPEDMLFSKEIELIEYVKREKAAGRNCLIYTIYNKVAKIGERVEKVLSENIEGLTIKVMPEHISGAMIEPWIEDNPCDILIASPLKLATGLDLVQFPTIMFYESGTNLRVIQQAARRSWRAVGQSKAVKVVFFAYEGIQAHILDIVAKKMRSAATIEGKKVVEGQIASVFDDDADFTAALNAIAEEIEQVFKPDFTSNQIEEGSLRPHTKLESEYLDILKEVKGDIGLDATEEMIPHDHVETVLVSVEHSEKPKIIEIELDDVQEEKHFEPIRLASYEDDDFCEQDFAAVTKVVKSENGKTYQAFDF